MAPVSRFFGSYWRERRWLLEKRSVLGPEERLRREQVQKKELWSCFQRRGGRRRDKAAT